MGVRDRRSGAQSSRRGDGEDDRTLAEPVRLDVVEHRLQLVTVEGEDDLVAAGPLEKLLEVVTGPGDADCSPLLGAVPTPPVDVEVELRRPLRILQGPFDLLTGNHRCDRARCRDLVGKLRRTKEFHRQTSFTHVISCAAAHKTSVIPGFFPRIETAL